MRAIIYCRYSTDTQSDTSIDDQARVCRARAAREGWEVVGLHSDAGVSGSTPVNARAGGARLLADALAGRADTLVLEGLDRLSRDQVEQEQIVRRLEHRGLRIVGVSDGYDSRAAGRKVMRTVRGLINEIYLDDLRAKTHRGLAGQLERGFHAGGLSYGYRSVAAEGGHILQVNDDHAAHVRWIFTHYSEGWSCQKLAAELNARGVPGPRGGTWAVSALYGSPAKGSGVLNNELYLGRVIWNRSQWVKDPDTGQRKRFDRPRNEWKIEERPALRIVSDGLWQAARTRMETPLRTGGGRGKGARPSTLFGGLLTCAHCGGAIVAISRSHYGCAANKDRGPAVCKGVRARRDATDTRMLSLVRNDLLDAGAQAELHQLVIQAWDELTRAGASERQSAKRRHLELEREIANLINAISSVGISPALAERLRNAETEKLRLRQQESAQEIPTPPSAEEIAAGMAKTLLDLESALRGDIDRARTMLRGLLGKVAVRQEGDQVWAELNAERAANLSNGGPILGLVAGARFLTQNRKRIRLQ